jgi:hypothetical protein
VIGASVVRQPPRTRVRGALIRLWQVVVVGAAVIAVLGSWLVVQAVAAPGNGSFVARLAAAARDDGLGPLATGLEDLGHWINPPGGRATPGQARSDRTSPRRHTATVTVPARPAGSPPGPARPRTDPGAG